MSNKSQAKSSLIGQIQDEIHSYLNEEVDINENYQFSQHDLVKRISMFESQEYPTGRFDDQDNYKFWFDIITPRIDSEVKNLDFDKKDIEVWSPRKIDELPVVLTNLKIREWLRENGKSEDINSAIEEGAGWGNVVWKDIGGDYEKVDLKNLYVINQTAESLDETPVIERHQYSQSELRSYADEVGREKIENLKDVINNYGQKIYSETVDDTGEDTTMPYYEIYERNGEVKLSDLKRFKGEEVDDGDEEKYVLAKVIAAGTESSSGGVSIKKIMFVEEMKEMPYKEYHRGRYKGRWFREGIYELLFDLQIRANQVGNQLAAGLEWASKVIFASAERTVANNIATDLRNGDIITSKDINQLEVRMQGFDQLANEWNRIQREADKLSNATEVARGESQPSGTPFRLAERLNINANKLYDFLREKLSIPLRQIFEEWVIPELVDDLSAKDVIRLTGDSDMLERVQRLAVEGWYLDNLIAIGPHTPDMAKTLKSKKMKELKEEPQLLMKQLDKVFEDFEASVSVVITAENSTKQEDLTTLRSFIQLETDPVRRTYLIEKAMKRAGIDIGDLPRSQAQAMQQGGPVSPDISEDLINSIVGQMGGGQQGGGQSPQEQEVDETAAANA